MANGTVVGGHFLRATVTTVIGSTLVVQSGLIWRKLNAENIAEWQEVPAEAKKGTAAAVGRAVTEAVAPRFLGKSASAAVGAAIDTAIRPSHVVRVDWTDGKQSLIKLPDSLFTHLALMLQEKRAPEPEVALALPEATSAPTAVVPVTPPTVTEQAFSLASEIVSEWRPKFTTPSAEQSRSTDRPNVGEQLRQIAALHDQGILTEEEFSAKKAELLSRL